MGMMTWISYLVPKIKSSIDKEMFPLCGLDIFMSPWSLNNLQGGVCRNKECLMTTGKHDPDIPVTKQNMWFRFISRLQMGFPR